MAKEDPSSGDQTEDPEDRPADTNEEQGRADQPEGKGETDDLNKQIADNLKSRAESSERYIREYYNEWKRNVELRSGKIASQYTGGVSVQDEVQTEVNPDWYLTKTKIANLFSTVPEVQGTHENDQFAPAVGPFCKALRFELTDKRTNLAAAMEEELSDVVNAAGIGGILTGWMARFEDKQVPAIDLKALPQEIAMALVQQNKVPMKTVPQVISSRFYCMRISAVDLLVPAEFSGSDFNDADYVGHMGRMPWGVAKPEFKLEDADKNKVLGTSEEKTEQTLRNIADKGGFDSAKVVKYKQLWYWRYRYDPNCKYFDEIWRIVWVHGKTDPVIHEKWKGQEFEEQLGQYVGARIFPLQILTLSYISDNAIPPSDSSAARPQVNDMRRSRSQMFQQRERSIPVRWYDVNRIDPLIADTIMRGSWQGMIPTNGDGSRSIGEIARASYPSEDMGFDQSNQQDLMRMWMLSPEQLGQHVGRTTKAQSQDMQQGNASRMGQERNKVAAHFLRICDVLMGLMSLYGTFPNLTDQEKQQMQSVWNFKQAVPDVVLKIRPDSTVVLDVGQRIQKLITTLNMTAKSGFVNPQPIIAEIIELSGLDPAKVMVQPHPKEPEEPNFSFRATGKEDLMNPMIVAMLMKGKRAPSPQELLQAKQLLQFIDLEPEQLQQIIQAQQAPGGQPGHGGGPGQPPPPGGPGAPPPNPAAPPGANAGWEMNPKVAKRQQDVAGH